jgi:hypothetical protein
MIYDLDFDPDEPLTYELGMQRLRSLRNALLRQSDWAVLCDQPRKRRRAWESYRQKLRDLPNQWDGQRHVTLPDLPVVGS